MSFNKNSFEKKFRVRLSECDRKGKLNLVSIFNIFQDSASEHADILGIGALNLLPEGYTWVILKYNIDIIKYPRWNNDITLHTKRATYKKLYEHREYLIKDNENNLLVRGLCSWVMVNFKTRRPVRLSRFLNEEMMSSGFEIPDEFIKIPSLEEFDYKMGFKVRRGDLDFNGHVNNTIYAGWAIEALPESIIYKKSLEHVEVNYIAEVSGGKNVLSYVKKIENIHHLEFIHVIKEKSNDKELARLRTIWAC